MRTLWLVLTGCCTLTACSTWPEAGRGGGEPHGLIAEATYLTVLNHSEQASLLAQAEVLDAQTELMVLQGAAFCVPAAILQLQQQGLKVRNQLTAELIADAMDDLATYQHLIRQVRWRFDGVRRQSQCALSATVNVPENHQQGTEFAIFSVLFDINSAAIGSGYQRHLQLIADLSQRCQCQLSLVGHTDQQGDAVANQKLAQQRVETVRQAMLKLGVSVVSEVSVGAAEPLVQQFANETLNRRVDIFIRPLGAKDAATAAPSALLLRQWHDAGVVQPR